MSEKQIYRDKRGQGITSISFFSINQLPPPYNGFILIKIKTSYEENFKVKSKCNLWERVQSKVG